MSITEQRNQGERWQPRKWAAWLTRALVSLLPFAAAIGAAVAVAKLLPDPTTLVPTIGWWIAVVGASYGASHVVSAAAAKLLPLAALLNMSLVFPDRAPSRFRIALRSGSSGLLRKEVERAIAAGANDNPTRSAEFALTLVASLGKHDRTTRGHAERTRAYTDLIAEELQLATADKDRLRWASLLHDIGKVKIDRAILQKNKPLDESEWDAVREHPSVGYELVTPIRQFLGPWAQTILHHHERFDGMGYPSGVAGDDIALGARIVAVADAYDAMTAARSYQQPVSRREALEELTQAAGTQFDPAIVRAFLRVSVGAMRRVAGPFVVLAQLPFIGGLRRVADSGAVVAASVIGLLAPLATGVAPTLSDDVPPPVVAQAPLTPGEGAPGTAPVPAIPPANTTSTQPDPNPVSADDSTTTLDPTTTSSTTTDPATTTSTISPPSTTSTTTAAPTTTSTTTTTTAAPPTTSTTTTTTASPPSGPEAVPDDATTKEDVAVTVDVLANDSDPDGDLNPASLTVVEPAAMGSAAVVAAQGQLAPAINYLPDGDAHGNDAFKYEICDLAGNCAQATVSLEVTAVNDPPVAGRDTASSALLTPVEIDVLANDSDVDGDRLAIESYSATSVRGGSVKCTSTCVYSPPVVWVGDDSFTYVVTDGFGGSDATTVIISPEIVSDILWYLRSSAAGDTKASSPLPLSIASGPTNSALPNYDIDRDSDPGLLVRVGGTGITQPLRETDPAKFQLWTYDVDDDTALVGTGTVTLHGAMKDLVAGVDGRVRVYLLDCPAATTTGSDCSTISLATVTRRPWSAVNGTWISFTANLGLIDYPIAAGRALAVKLAVAGDFATEDMWFAYDAAGLVSTVEIAASALEPTPRRAMETGGRLFAIQ